MSLLKKLTLNLLNGMQFHSFDYLGQDSNKIYFQPFADRPYSILFDSGQADSEDARFDIIAVHPEKVMRFIDNQTEIISFNATEENPPTILANVDAFEELNRWLNEFHSLRTIDEDIPFIGGVAGAIAYDMGRTLEALPDIAKSELHCPDLVFGLYLSVLIVDHKQKTVRLYYHPEITPLSTVNHLVHEIKTSLESRSNNKPKAVPDFVLSEEWQSNMTKDDYFAKFDSVKRYIKSGDCYQINLAQRFRVSFEGDIWQAYDYLTSINQAPFSAFFHFGEGQLLSLSPERFISIADRHVKTQPIKGTRPRGLTPEEDNAYQHELTTSEKDRAENLMIVDLLRNDLGRTAQAGSVKVSELFGLYSFPSVHHLISTIESDIDENTSVIDVIREAFPGGSITGAPKVRAMEIIEELEPHRRHFYCGSILYAGFNGKMDSNILIRSLIAQNKVLYTWAGGGLVDDSEAQLEYHETFAKLSKILKPLAEKHGNVRGK